MLAKIALALILSLAPMASASNGSGATAEELAKRRQLIKESCDLRYRLQCKREGGTWVRTTMCTCQFR